MLVVRRTVWASAAEAVWAFATKDYLFQKGCSLWRGIGNLKIKGGKYVILYKNYLLIQMLVCVINRNLKIIILYGKL